MGFCFFGSSFLGVLLGFDLRMSRPSETKVFFLDGFLAFGFGLFFLVLLLGLVLRMSRPSETKVFFSDTFPVIRLWLLPSHPCYSFWTLYGSTYQALITYLTKVASHPCIRPTCQRCFSVAMIESALFLLHILPVSLYHGPFRFKKSWSYLFCYQYF